MSPGHEPSLEASIGALADSAADFEAPAPPALDNRVGDWVQTDRLARKAESAVGVPSLGRPTHVTLQEAFRGVDVTKSGRDGRSHDSDGQGARSLLGEHAHRGKAAEEEVLHGVSAAVASGALSGSADAAAGSNASLDAGSGGPAGGNQRDQRDRRCDWEQGRCGSPNGDREELSTGAHGDTRRSLGDEDRASLTRKHVEQALRDRASRRQHRFEVSTCTAGPSVT